ncbi:cell division protein FtsL [Parasulfuritortus cantonensis]|uniref:Cell division protein FtsL n=1 Tax=Parasulfuritortus cantonensis TaxID=2528202 RepID=A0A4R1BN13_9PROT|nr:cell division protein FtsL [Parasulfuritortus cantonensis]TCJ18718.1 cell division protein FtsL [Parasulfuritortus cantonensis]
MFKLTLPLAIVLAVCALAVVTARHQARKLFVELQSQERQGRELDIEWGRLQLEQSTWAMHARIEQIARGQLQMSVPDLKHIEVVRADAQAAPEAAR